MEEVKSKLDSTKILEILLIKYSQKILDNIQEELRAVYTECKNYSLTLQEHSKEHHKTIDMLQNINKDLEKIYIERSLINRKEELSIDQIKQDLSIANYKITKSKKQE